MSRLSASYKIFFTSLYGNFFTYTAYLTVDVLLEFVEYCKKFSTKRSWKEIRSDVLRGTSWMSKRIILSVLFCVGNATGMSIGGYVSEWSMGMTFGGLLVELAISSFGNAILFML